MLHTLTARRIAWHACRKVAGGAAIVTAITAAIAAIATATAAAVASAITANAAAASIAASITTAAAAASISAREVGGLPPSLAPAIGSGSVLHRTVGFDSRVLADFHAAAAEGQRRQGSRGGARGALGAGGAQVGAGAYAPKFHGDAPCPSDINSYSRSSVEVQTLWPRI